MRDASEQPSATPAGEGTELRLKATVGDREVFRFRTRDGVQSPESFRPAELQLIEVLAEDPPATLLVPDANYGVVGTVMGAFARAVWMTERSARAANLCRENAATNGVDGNTSTALTADLGSLATTFDAVAMAPPAYDPVAAVNQRIVDAVTTLSPGGELYLAADAAAGLARYEETLRELAGTVETVAEGAGVRVIRAADLSRTDLPTYAEPTVIRPEIGGVRLTLETYPGLFSAAELDEGTRQLAESIEFEPGERVLDLGCGYGPLGVYAAKTTDCAVWLTDDDCVATACAQRSAARSDVSVRDVLTADATAGVAGRTFHRVVSNPPTHAGAGVLHDLMRGARGVMADDGTLQVVHHEGVAFDSYLDPYYDHVESVGRGEYRIVTARP